MATPLAPKLEPGTVVLSSNRTYPGIVLPNAGDFHGNTVRWFKWGWQHETFDTYEFSPAQLLAYDGRFGTPPARLIAQLLK